MAVFPVNWCSPKIMVKQIGDWMVRSQIFVVNNCTDVIKYKTTVEAVDVDQAA